MTKISEATYNLALTYAARMIIDKEEAERDGRKLSYDLDAVLQGWTSFAFLTACGKPLGNCTKEDLEALHGASLLVVDYLMLSAAICEARLGKNQTAALTRIGNKRAKAAALLA
jgi:hypothetical protein